jgi:hypothetical protein
VQKDARFFATNREKKREKRLKVKIKFSKGGVYLLLELLVRVRSCQCILGFFDTPKDTKRLVKVLVLFL